MRRLKPFNTAYEQYLKVTEESRSAEDIRQKNIYFHRRITLLGVMEFLLQQR